jgi:hypothetical protein
MYPQSPNTREEKPNPKRERGGDQYPILIMDLACLRSTKTAEKQPHLKKQNLQNPKCKKEG